MMGIRTTIVIRESNNSQRQKTHRTPMKLKFWAFAHSCQLFTALTMKPSHQILENLLQGGPKAVLAVFVLLLALAQAFLQFLSPIF